MREVSISPRTSVVTTSLVLAFCLFGSHASAQEAHEPAAKVLGLDQVLTNLEQRNAERAAALEQFEAKRIYRMQYRGFFKDQDAQMVVKVRFHAPNDKEFTIVSQTGSSFVIDHVFKKLLQGEQEAAKKDHQREVALTRENYNFSFLGYETTPEGGRYILGVTPKTKNKFLYRGTIWVDATDFAVVRIEGEPGKSPSMWISKTDFAHRYMKVDDFWLPSENYTETSVRLGGKSTLSIKYEDYRILKTSALRIVQTARISSAPF